MEIVYPARLPAIRVDQPLGSVLITKTTARLLLDVTFSDPLTVIGGGRLAGAQREESDKRLKEIGRFIETTEAAFPNSVILAANYSEDRLLIENTEEMWRIEDLQDDGKCFLVIPTAKKLASIVDGQHRLHGFRYADPSRAEMELVCAVYLDLPNPYQAYLFATINFNQKKVDRSLAYELFGFNVEDEPPDSWSPDKAAVYFCRRLNTIESSPLYRRIIVSAQNDELLFLSRGTHVDWVISTATVVDGILRLYSAKPNADRDMMFKSKPGEGRTRGVLAPDGTPLRELYVKGNDLAVYTVVENFFAATSLIFWAPADGKSYIRKTVGVQALFDILRLLLKRDFVEKRAVSKQYFLDVLAPAKGIDFADEFFQASGIGRTRIKNAIADKIGLT